ncbi:cold shock domain-containing protein [Streptomyces sp. NPDC006514]|uniref:cold-shock protein n=1 Tax=Streptomyces sp. NPDC006514 TaxID=3154308 RepID=UPI00339E51E2
MKWFDPDRGIGLISQEGAGPDVQAVASAIHAEDRRLGQGEEVLFDITLDSAGLRADNIRRTRHGAAPGQEMRRARTALEFTDGARSAGPQGGQYRRTVQDMLTPATGSSGS